MTDYKPNRSFFQVGVERFKTILKGGIPDRVPVAAQMHEFSMKEKGLNARDFYTSAKLFVPAVLETMEKYSIDMPFLDFDVYNIEAEALGQKIKYSNENMPDVDPRDWLLKDKDNLRNIKTPNFYTDGRFSNVVEMHRLFRELTGVDPVIRFTAAFSLATLIRGADTLILDIFDDPEWVKELFTVLTEQVLTPYLLHLKKHVSNAYPGHGMGGADAMASPPTLSPDMIKEWVLPYFLRLMEVVGQEVYLPNWVGDRYFKNPEDMFDMKLKVCPAFLEVQDPDVEEIGPEICKEYAKKHNVPLVIGLGAAFLAMAKPDEVFKRAKYYVEVGGENGQFYLYLCNIGATTPPENVRAAINAVHKYGTYNL
jgi:uroporphyrinogen-III decarboxylase